QIELKGVEDEQRADDLLALLNQLSWASRTAVLPRYPGVIARERWQPKATALVAVAERQWADVADLASRIRKAGFTIAAIHLTHFGTVRLRTQFGMEKPTKEAQQSIEAVYRGVAQLAGANFTAAGTKPDFKLTKNAEVAAE